MLTYSNGPTGRHLRTAPGAAPGLSGIVSGFRDVGRGRPAPVGKEDSGSAAEVYAKLKELEKKFEDAQGAGGKGGGGKAKGAFVDKATVDRFVAYSSPSTRACAGSTTLRWQLQQGLPLHPRAQDRVRCRRPP